MVKNPLANARDVDSISGLGRSLGEGNGNLLQYSCLENSMDRGDWEVGYSPWGCKQLDSTEHTCRECTYIINKNCCITQGTLLSTL